MSARTEFDWRKSSFSGSQGECVEVARNIPGVVALRDSKDPTGPVLQVPASAWTAFLAGLRSPHPEGFRHAG